jgi:uncharacterized protein DUF4350/uncharacterized protein DUF4129
MVNPMRSSLVSAALFLAALAFAPRSFAASAGPDPMVRAVLEDDRYRFCHEADYPLSAEEHEWCSILSVSSEVCPSLARACELPPATKDAGARPPLKKAEKPAEKKPEQPRDPASPEDAKQPHDEPDQVTVAPSLSLVSRVLFILVILAFVVMIARAIAKSFFRGAGDEAPPVEAAPAAPARADAPAPRGPVETDVDRLLARARAAAARGDYGRAIEDAYAALLRRLDGDGHIDIHPSRTNGDYVRQLRDRADLRGAVRDVVREVERVHFGAAAPTERAFRAVLDRVVPLVSRALVVALFCLGASAIVACSPLAAATSRADTRPNSPSGSQALSDLLTKHDFKVKRRTEPLADLTGVKTLVVRASTPIDAEAWTHLLTWVDAGGRLLIGGSRNLPPELHLAVSSTTLPGTVLHIDQEHASSYGKYLVQVPAGPALLRTDVSADDADEVSDPVLMRGDATYAAVIARGEGQILIFADDRLFTNAALTVPGNSMFLVKLFEAFPMSREIEIADAWTGAGASTPFAAVAHAELLPVIVQLFLLLALLYLWKGMPFARLRDPPAETRRAFADHARALGLAYGRARASKHVLGLYASWALERLRERVQRSGRQGLIPLAEAIAARTGRPEADVMRVLVDAGSAREETAPLSLSYARSARFEAKNKPPRRDAAASEFALMRELEGFLTATGRRRRARRSAKENPHA